MKKIILLLVIAATCATAQDNDERFRQAMQLKNDGRLEEALVAFEQLVKIDSSRVEYLYNTSFLYSKLGNRQQEEAARQRYFQKGEYFAQRAVARDPNNAEAHYTYALALARKNEYASSREKISNAKLIKTECETALKLNPKHSAVWHILGRWHRTVAGFNFVEKGMINAFFGGVPEGGSYKDAIDCLSKAVLLEPGYMLHKFELAQTYYERGEGDDYILCKIWCKKVLAMTPLDQDDKRTLVKAQQLLSKVE
jgi:regulator of microtubule dynamics protein 3